LPRRRGNCWQERHGYTDIQSTGLEVSDRRCARWFRVCRRGIVRGRGNGSCVEFRGQRQEKLGSWPQRERQISAICRKEGGTNGRRKNEGGGQGGRVVQAAQAEYRCASGSSSSESEQATSMQLAWLVLPLCNFRLFFPLRKMLAGFSTGNFAGLCGLHGRFFQNGGIEQRFLIHLSSVSIHHTVSP
jgi:hypothetical protein